MLFFWIFVLLASFYLLARISDDHFVVSLEELAQKYKLSSDMAGATLMAIGSSAPELFVSLAALIKPGDHAIVGVGTIVGSALFNILVIVGVAASVKRSVVTWQPVVRDSIFYTLSIILLMWFFGDGKVGIIESLVLLGSYGVYILVVLYWRQFFPYEDDADSNSGEEEGDSNDEEGMLDYFHKKMDRVLAFIFPSNEHPYYVFWVSIFYIGLLSWVLVESAVAIAHLLNIPEAIIALTILAVGTSIPDCIASYVVAKKGKGGMAISNAIGSNIFDILVGLGLPIFLVLFFTGNGVEVATKELEVSTALLFASVIATAFVLWWRKWVIDYKTGYFLIGLYFTYFAWAAWQVL